MRGTMADDAVKTVVAKLNLDASTVADVVKDFRAQLSALSSSSQTQAKQDQAATAAAIAGTKEQVAATKDVTAAKQESTNAAIAGAAKEKSAKDALYAAELDNLAKRGAILDSQNEKIKISIELMRERNKESSKGEEGGVSLSGVAGAVGAGAFGGGVLGSTLSGLLKGAGLTLGIEAAYEGITKLTEKVKEFIEDSGGLQKVTETFQNLAPAHGADPTEFLEKLRSSTHNLVNDVDLLREANSFMQSGLKLSSDDMVKLTEATVGLARSQGNDAQQAVQNLTRAFLSGRTGQLGYQVGIQKTLLQVTGLGATLSETAKAQLTFAQTAKLIEDRFAALGQPMLTYTDRLKQLQVVQGQLFEGAAQGTVNSQGFTSFMKTLGDIIDHLGGMESIARKIGNALGNMFSVVGAGFVAFGSTARTAFSIVAPLVETLNSDLQDTSDHFRSAAGGGDTFTDMLQRQHPILLANIKFMAELGRQTKLFMADFTAAGDLAMLPVRTADIMSAKQKTAQPGQYSGLGGQAKLFKDAFDQAQTEISDRYKTSSDEADKSYNDLVSGQSDQYMRGMKDKNPNWKGKNVPPPTDPSLARKEALAVAKATMDEKIAAAKETLAKIKELLEDETEANEKAYKEDGEAAAAFYARKDEIATASYLATVAELGKERDAKQADLKVQLQQNQIFKPVYDKQVADSNDVYNRGVDEAGRTRNKSVASDQQGLFADSKAQINKTADEQLQIQKQALAEQVEATKNAFAQNAIDANQYHTERIAEIYAELQAVEDAEAKKQATMTATEKIASAGKVLAARQTALGQLQQRGEQEPDEILNNIQQGFNTQLGVNKGQQGVAAAAGMADGANMNLLKLQEQQIVQAQVTALTSQMSAMTIKAGEQWDKINQSLQQAKEHLASITDEIKDQTSITSEVGGTTSAIGAAGSGLFTGTFGRGFMNSFSQGAAQLAGGSKGAQQWSGDASDSSGSGATNMFSALKDGISDVIGGNGSDGLSELTKTLGGAATAVGGFAKVIASATSPLGGAFGGAQAGAGLGQSLGLGPLGAVAGAAGGAILGAIVGQKQQQVQQDIVNIQLAARQMQEAFSSGSASLNATITTLQGLITTLTSEQSSSKKGSSQFQDLINQYNQQLSQLEAQQTQVIQQMTQQLASVSSPQAYQQWIQNIDSVIQQYAQFAGAAQNATQLAQANEYLTSSLQNIGQQMGDQLMQEEESAIQNALTLNQLYNQRNQLELQYLNQVQSIMSQGNVTRQRTQAQSAFSQLYDAQVNYSQQLDSINQQINLAQYQLNVEQQIFNLATTKAGLESQLLSLQEQGVNEDMQRIVAMQNLLQTLQSTGYSITNLSSLSANDPNALQNTLLQDLINELGTGQGTMIQQLTQLINVLTEYGGLPGSATATGLSVNTPTPAGSNPNVATDMLSALYQSRAQFGYGAYRGQNL